MKRVFLPYYVSRLVLSLILAALVFGITWKALLLAALFFALFLLYLHSGWFQVDTSRPLFPLGRDERGREVQRRALIAALVGGVLVFVILSALPLALPAAVEIGPIAMMLGAVVYFGVEFFLLARG